MYIDKTFDILSDWYKRRNFFWHLLSQFIYFVISYPLYWINHGKKQILSASKTVKEMRIQGREVKINTKLDIIYEFIFHGFMASEYNSYFFEKKSFKERRAYYSEMDHWKFSNICNKKDVIKTLRDKRKSYQVFKEWYKREQIIVNSKDDLNIYCQFISKHPIFFKKPFNGCCGVNAGWFDSSKYSSPLDSLEAIVKDGPFVLEEGVHQCDLMKQFNPDSINTLRIITVLIKGEATNLFALVRTGRKGSPVDNAGSGGIIIGVDMSTGKLLGEGTDNAGRVFKEHPDTNVKFEGFKLPYWEEACILALNLIKVIPGAGYIGWDIALTDKGPVIIEANGQTSLHGPQIIFKKGLKKQFNEILNRTRD